MRSHAERGNEVGAERGNEVEAATAPSVFHLYSPMNEMRDCRRASDNGDSPPASENVHLSVLRGVKL